jgi:SH3-like domain-containing protein
MGQTARYGEHILQRILSRIKIKTGHFSMIYVWRCLKPVLTTGFVFCMAWWLGSSVSAWAQETQISTTGGKGQQSGLPIPRFVSLKSAEVNVRRGPGVDHETAWTFKRMALPVEITAEWDTWRRVRYVDGSEGWVLGALLSGKRTVMIAPWSKEPTLPLRARAKEDARITARLEPNVLANIKICDGKWCRIEGKDFEGWIAQGNVWGAYPNEIVE